MSPSRFLGFLAAWALITGCASRSHFPLRFEAATPWADPIRAYLEAGEEHFPQGFSRGITTLEVFDGRLWMGYGDATRNMGSKVPIEFRSLASSDDPTWVAAPVLAGGQGAPQRTPTDTGEEQIEPYRVCGGVLCQAGVDSTDADELWTQAKGPERRIEGNFFRYEDGSWRKLRTIPGGEHVHDLGFLDGVIYAVGSGADDRAEFEGGQIFRYLWRSRDQGATFETVQRVLYPEFGKGDTRFRKLLAVGRTLYVFGYVEPDGGPREGRHLRVGDGELEELGGVLATRVVARTYELPDGTGLVVTRSQDGRTRVFRARENGFTDLVAWAERRVIDAAVAPEHARLLVLSGDLGEPEHFAVHSASLDALEELELALDFGLEAPSALALWEHRLFIGTNAGAIWRALPVVAHVP